MSNSPHVSVQHAAGVKWGESATVGGLLGGVQLERLGGTAWKTWGERVNTPVSLNILMTEVAHSGRLANPSVVRFD